MKPLCLVLVLTFTIAGSEPAKACLWDKDTLAMEKRGLPGTFELLTGRFLRHSKAYYQWRVVDRTKRLAETPDDLALLDDLAVAYDKLGEHEAALKTARRSLSLSPERYETHANLGTLLIHAGDLKAGLVHIKRAIAINPDAHFGREVVQQRLVEYVLAWRRGGERTQFPIADSTYCEDTLQPDGKARDDLKHLCEGRHALNFVSFIKRHKLSVPDAMRGVRGMMRFGNWKSPVLREVLGDLLLGAYSQNSSRPSRSLAAMAYLAAGDTAASGKQAYRRRAEDVLRIQYGMHLEMLTAKMAQAMAKGARWFDMIQRREAKWIEAGAEVDAKYAKTYYLKAARERRDFAPVALVARCRFERRHALPTTSVDLATSIPVGLTEEALVDRFGLPECTLKSRWYYSRTTPDGEFRQLVTFDKGKVTKVLGRLMANEPGAGE